VPKFLIDASRARVIKALLTFFCNAQLRRWYSCKNRRRFVLIIVDWLIEERFKNWTFQRTLFYQRSLIMIRRVLFCVRTLYALSNAS